MRFRTFGVIPGAVTRSGIPGDLSGPESACGNSGTTGPGTLPVVPLFQKSPGFEVIIRKNAEHSPEFANDYRQE
jgi:hypothetical protein